MHVHRNFHQNHLLRIGFGSLSLAGPPSLGALALAALAAHAFYVLALGLDHPALDLHSFRQTQTAISAYWLWQGGPWLDYATPVLGHPWAIPFEFPLYQGAVAALRGAGIPIDVGGRLLSFAFYLATLWPLRVLLRSLGYPRQTFIIIAALYLASPIYLYWSRTVMIESCSLFLCTLWLALLARYLERRSSAALIGAIGAGASALLVKGLTLPAFALLGGAITLAHLWRMRHDPAGCARLAGAALASVVLPLAIGLAWLLHADAVKQHNVFAAEGLTNGKLVTWYVGTFGSGRFSAPYWRDIVLARAMPDIFGYAFLLAPLLVGAAFVGRYALATLALIAVFVLSLVAFPNLHMVHNYYQTAIAIFLLAAVGLALTTLTEHGRQRTAAVLLLVVVAGQLAFFHVHYAPILRTDYTRDDRFQIAQLIKQTVPAGASILVLGDNWSPAIPYYSERKALVLPSFASTELVRRVLADPAGYVEGLGAIIYCPASIELYYGEREPFDADYSRRVPLVEAFIAGRTKLAEVGHNAGGCQVLSAKR
jgi:hypothetical protein